LILTALELERSEGAVIADKVGDTACIFLAGLYRAEQAIAERLIRIVSGRLPCGHGSTKRRPSPGSKSAAVCSLPTVRRRRSAWR
jgi:hypothetical protein